MKKIFSLILSVAFISAHAQTADDVVSKYIDGMGGLDAYKSIKTAKLTGNVSQQGMDIPLTVQIINGRAERTDVTVMGSDITSACKDGAGWSVNPLQGGSDAKPLEGEMLKQEKSKCDLVSSLMGYKEKGNTIELEGKEDVDGAGCYKIKLTAKEDNSVTQFFINASTYELVKSISTVSMMGQEAEVETYYSDLKPVGKVKMFYTRTQKVEGQVVAEIKFDTIEIDIPIDEKIFDMPKN